MLPGLNPLLHSELRLGVMSILRKETGATAGNLSVQLEKLSQAGYIAIEKGFRGKIPRTTCRITPEGTEALHQYVKALEHYLKGVKKGK